MTDIDHILLAPVGNYLRASSRLRVYDWIPRLQDLGAKVAILQPEARASSAEGWAETIRLFPDIPVFVPSDVEAAIDWSQAIVAQERPLAAAPLRRISRLDKRLVFDFSDPIHASPAGDWTARGLHHRLWASRAFRRTIDGAAHVLVENDSISAELAKSGHTVSVIRGPVDPDRFRPYDGGATTDGQESGGPTTIGWTGSRSTYEFLKELLPVLDGLGESLPIKLTIIGAPEEPALSNVAVESITWRLDTEPMEVAKFDIGLFYQPSTRWTALRGGGKIPQYMAAGVPVVASDNGVACQMLVHERTGFLAKSMDEWAAILADLIARPERQAQVSAEARRQALDQYTYDATIPIVAKAIGLAHP